MPRARKKKTIDPHPSEIPATTPAVETLAREFDLPTADQIPDPHLPTFEAKAHAAVKTARPFTGRIAHGRGRTVTADDTSFAIESTTPLTAGEIALAQRNGFDDFSENGTGQIMVADKAELRQAGGEVNWVARALTGKDAGRER